MGTAGPCPPRAVPSTCPHVCPPAPQGQAPPGEQLLLYWGPQDGDVHPLSHPLDPPQMSPDPSTLHVGLLQQPIGGCAGLGGAPGGAVPPIQPRWQHLGGFCLAQGLFPGALGARGGHRGRLLRDVPPQHARGQPRPLGRPCRKGGDMGRGCRGGNPSVGSHPHPSPRLTCQGAEQDPDHHRGEGPQRPVVQVGDGVEVTQDGRPAGGGGDGDSSVTSQQMWGAV